MVVKADWAHVKATQISNESIMKDKPWSAFVNIIADALREAEERGFKEGVKAANGKWTL